MVVSSTLFNYAQNPYLHHECKGPHYLIQTGKLSKLCYIYRAALNPVTVELNFIISWL